MLSRTRKNWPLKKVFLKVSQNSQENSCAKASLSIKLQSSSVKLYLKRGSGTGAFVWIWWIFKTIYFIKHLRTAASIELFSVLQIRINLNSNITYITKIKDKFAKMITSKRYKGSQCIALSQIPSINKGSSQNFISNINQI